MCFDGLVALTSGFLQSLPINHPDTAARANRRKLTDRFVRSITPEIGRVVHWWDTAAPGLFVATHGSGRQSWRVGYRVDGRPVGFKLSDVRSITLADAVARHVIGVVEGRVADNVVVRLR